MNWLKSLFGIPTPTGPAKTFRTFKGNEPTLTQTTPGEETGAWHFDVKEKQVLRLFEVPVPELQQCLITYRARVKTQELKGQAYLEMWCRVAGRGEFFSKGLNQTVSGTQDWALFEIPFYLKKDQPADLLKLNVVVEGTGRLWIKDIQILTTPMNR